MLLFTNAQLKRLANIFGNAGQGTLVSAVLTPLLSFKAFPASTLTAVVGLVLTLFLWGISLKFERISTWI